MVILNSTQRETLIAIVDTFVAPLSQQEEATLIKYTLDTPGNCFTEAKVSEFAKLSGSKVGTLDRIEQKLAMILSPKQISEFSLILNLLSYRPTSIMFTGHWSLFKDLDYVSREKVLLGWKKSSYATFRQLYNSFMGIGVIESYNATETPLYKSIMYQGIQGGQPYLEAQPGYKKVRHERLPMLTTEEAQSLNKQFDAIVIGSGAGGGVTAAELAKAGLSVLVIEKGKYFHQDDLKVDDESFAFANLYDNGGTTPNASGNLNFTTASNFGGGTTINYSASIGPQQFVKEQWEKTGLTYFGSEQFDKDIESVLDRIGASAENIVHSEPNLKLMQGCRNLNYEVNPVPQNTSGRSHQCGKCYTGCPSGIKNSTTNTYLKDAASHGAKFLDSTQVSHILIKDGKAVGVSCKIHGGKESFEFYAKTVVVAGGALHTPSLLQKSGLKNPNIGHDLRMHLTVMTVGIYDEVINPSQGSLLTTVSPQFENYDGTTFGFKLECFSSGLGMFSGMMPWDGAAAHKQRMLRHRNSVAFFAMARDMDSTCSVKYDTYDKLCVDFTMSKHDGDTLVEGIVQMAKVHVAGGAREVHVTQYTLDSFIFDKDEESRVDNPRFLKWIQSVYEHGPSIPCSGHQMASCRMGVSPLTSATKATGETWDVSNLYVSDSSLFPTALGVNPMVTIQAIAMHVSRNIIAEHNKLSEKL